MLRRRRSESEDGRPCCLQWWNYRARVHFEFNAISAPFTDAYDVWAV